MKKLILIMTVIAISLSSCLKDKSYVNFASGSNVVNFPQSGLDFFGNDAILSDTTVVQFAVDYATANPNPAISATVAVDPTLITSYEATNSAITYELMPTSAYTLSATTVSIPAGQQYSFITLTVYKNTLDPSKSYMLPIKIASATAGTISANQSVHYFHVIGNDFAGAYTWDYRRYNNGTGPGNNPDGTPAIPSLNQGGATSSGTTLGQAGKILPISPTEFEMTTGYNGQMVMYDVTFTRSVSGSTVSYSNWAVTFNAANIALWTNAGIALKTPPTFTLPPPATNASPKFFEMNYVAGGASPRYIDDTYHQ